MRSKSLSFVTAGLMLIAALAIAQEAKTLTGTVSDAMCGKTHMMQGASAATCTRECVKAGSGYALVVGDKVYTLKGGSRLAIDKFAGANAVVKGKLSGNTVTVGIDQGHSVERGSSLRILLWRPRIPKYLETSSHDRVSKQMCGVSELFVLSR